MEVTGNGGKRHGKSPYSKKVTTRYAQNLAACKEELKDVKRQLEISNNGLKYADNALKETKQELELLQKSRQKLVDPPIVNKVTEAHENDTEGNKTDGNNTDGTESDEFDEYGNEICKCECDCRGCNYARGIYH